MNFTLTYYDNWGQKTGRVTLIVTHENQDYTLPKVLTNSIRNWNQFLKWTNLCLGVKDFVFEVFLSGAGFVGNLSKSLNNLK